MNSDDLYKIKYYKYKKKYITLRNSNVSKVFINRIIPNFSINNIHCMDNEKCNKIGIFKNIASHFINNRWDTCEGWNCF